METFNLLESGVIVEGVLVTQLNPVECEEAQVYNCTEGANPVWMFGGRPIEVTLESPMVYGIFNEDETVIHVQSEIWIKKSAIKSLQIALFITEDSDTIYIAAGHSDEGVPPDEVDETYQIKFDVIASERLQGKTKLELYSFREDPKTSRGTVTTVMHHKSTVEK
jgi:hypothetical protein